MRIFVYEWTTGGGLVEEPGALPVSLVREGMAMLGALTADLVQIKGSLVTVLRDPRMLQLTLPGCDIVDVQDRASHDDEFIRLAGESDATILIAPEFDGILLSAAKRVGEIGGRLISPSAKFVRVATDKHRTCEILAAAGVPVPPGMLLEPDEPLPEDFSYPAVVKPNDGAGSQDTFTVSGPHEAPAYAWPRRLERYLPGLAASVAVLCGPAGRVTLEPCRQRISEDGRLRYLGGELPLAGGLAERAVSLAERAMGAMPSTIGYVGVDMVLGRDPHGSEDAVFEINPRLTTSYVGLRAAAKTNLAEAMWRMAQGEHFQLEFSDRAVEFDSSGIVSFVR